MQEENSIIILPDLSAKKVKVFQAFAAVPWLLLRLTRVVVRNAH